MVLVDQTSLIGSYVMGTQVVAKLEFMRRSQLGGDAAIMLLDCNRVVQSTFYRTQYKNPFLPPQVFFCLLHFIGNKLCLQISQNTASL